jgi:hypothetical protein
MNSGFGESQKAWVAGIPADLDALSDEEVLELFRRLPAPPKRAGRPPVELPRAKFPVSNETMRAEVEAIAAMSGGRRGPDSTAYIRALRDAS